LIHVIAWLLGLDDVAAIDGARLDLGAAWARYHPFWLLLSACAVLAVSLFFYMRTRANGASRARLILAICRGSLLALLLVTLAEPIVELTVIKRQRPRVYLVFDGTESMAIADEMSPAERQAIERSVGWQRDTSPAPKRIDYVQSLLAQKNNAWLAQLAKQNVDLEAFLFTGNTTSRLQKLELPPARSRQIDGERLASQLTATGQVTALGAVVDDLYELAARSAGAIVLFSDFAHNAGPPPLGASPSATSRLTTPIHTVGVGATDAIDATVDLQIDPKLKKAERSNLVVKLRQSGLVGQQATVRLTARKMTGDATSSLPIGQRTIALESELETIDFPFTPDDAGRFEFTAKVEPLTGEVSELNNQTQRQVNIVDDYLRLMYVAHEPTWEWRFVKEVFHRDKLVGMEGFRTFLNSSDPQVRENNILFLPTLTPRRSEFFATDVLMLDDLPRELISERFAELVKEYVADLGGGLVVLAGPRFGPRDLYQTPLADMLPVIVDPQGQVRTGAEHAEFRPRLTSQAARYSFMQLDLDPAANQRAWDNLGRLPWYQPVAMVHPQAEVLAEHPTDRCVDGKTPQPLIAVRKYGKGEVVYLGFNEMWRLRRQYGEKFYRQFWSQLIYRLGMSHALGPDKRFVASVDQPQYKTGDRLTLSVEAYDENYEPLGQEGAQVRSLEAELELPAASGASAQALSIPLVREGLFETRIPVTTAGSYRVRVIDPVTSNTVEQRFEVTSLSAERQRAVRDEKLQNALAQATGGRSYDLTNVDRLPAELNLKPAEQRLLRNVTLWTTPLWFGLVVTLMLGEWLGRKLLRLP
jgi:hypothetical protein